MRALGTAILAGAAAAVFGFPGMALAQNSNMHTMTVQLPGGGMAEIRYTGNIPPQVTVSAGRAAAGDILPVGSMLGANSPFGMLDRITAEMDREAAALFRYADAMSARPWPGASGLTLTNLQNLPPETRGFSYISTMSGNGVCTRSTEITATGNGPPRVVTHSSGNCGPEPRLPGNAGWGAPGIVHAPATPAPSKRPDLLWTKNETAPQPYVTMVRDAAAR
jgi:hypothetical protein